MFELLKNRAAKRQFLWFASLAGAVSLVLHTLCVWFLTTRELSSGWRTIAEVSSGLSAAIATGALTAGFLLLMFGYLWVEEEKLRRVEVLDPVREHDLHEEALFNTEIWFHNGHIGRWVRTKALPTLARASMEGTSCEAKLLLLNPADKDVCDRYSRYRQRVARSEKPGFSTVDDTIAEVLATIVSCVAYGNVTGLRTSIFFKSSFDASRLDFASTVAFRTLVSPRAIGVAYFKATDPRNPGMYEALRDGFENALAEADQFTPRGGEALSMESLDERTVATFLEQNALPCTPSMASSVLKRVKSKYTPFS